MTHYFLINPAAGRKDRADELEAKIQAACRARGVDFEVYRTCGVGDATAFTRRVCAEASGPVRFYACGGDGTLGEVACGMADCPMAQLALIPTGTGNDFARNFSGREAFSDPEAQLDGEVMPIDLLQINGLYCVNMVNIGFDSEVVVKVAQIKKSPFVPGKLAYIFGVAMTFFRMPGVKASISIDGEQPFEADLQLLTAGNGGFCGGGFHSNPHARPNSGVIDFLKVKKVSRLTFVRLIGKYRKGTHLDNDDCADLLSCRTCRTLDMTFDKPMHICIDGETVVTDRVHIQVCPQKISFVVPRGSRLAVSTSEAQALAEKI